MIIGKSVNRWTVSLTSKLSTKNNLNQFIALLVFYRPKVFEVFRIEAINPISGQNSDVLQFIAKTIPDLTQHAEKARIQLK
ncbi:MAG: hypothetical protein R3297_08755 [Desulfobulbales bacterium]|nr:hypothetical protein [Desulfobulbales bacterium]